MKSFAITHVGVFTVDAADQVIANGTVLVEDDRIVAVGPAAAITVPDGIPVIDGEGKHALIPGLVDSHSHSSLMRGVTENMPLMQWLPY